MRKIAFAAIFTVLCVGCGSSTDTGSGDQDSSVDDSAIADSGARDTATTDSAKDSTSDSSTTDSAPGDAPTDTTTTDSSTTDAATDSATDTTSVDTGGDASFTCGSGATAARCTAGQICVEDNVMGGACLACDSSTTCPTGMHCPAGSGCCVRDPTFHCADKPAACSTVTCSGACGKALCPSSVGTGACGCEGPSSDGTITCNVCAP